MFFESLNDMMWCSEEVASEMPVAVAIGISLLIFIALLLGFYIGKEGMAHATKRPGLIFCASAGTLIMVWLQRSYNFHAKPIHIASTAAATFIGFFIGLRKKQRPTDKSTNI